MTIFQLIYRSTASLPIDIDSIVSQARNNNERDGLTGCLLFDGAHFAQILEGEQGDVWQTFLKIKSDSRHTAVELMRMSTGKPTRLFAEWSMGLYQLGPLAPYGQADIPSSSADQLMLTARNLAFLGDRIRPF